MRRSIWNKLFVLGVITFVIAPFQNCAKTPKVEQLSAMSALFSHTGNEMECLSCHTNSRPVSDRGFAAYNAKAPFDLTTHGNGLDCVACHAGMANTVRSFSDWGNGFFQHKLSLTTCSECHTTQRPLTTAGGLPHAADGDCFSCHSPVLPLIAPLTAVNYLGLDSTLWKNANGAPTGPQWDATKDIAATVRGPNYDANGLFVSWSTQAQTLHMPMNHQASIPGVTMSQCSTCHSNTTNYAGGRLHSTLATNLIAQPTNCLTCHNSSQASTVPTLISAAFTEAHVGPAQGQNATTNPSSFNHVSVAGLSDCNSCHSQANWNAPNWKLGQFHKTTNVPTSCQECHRSSRPLVAKGAMNFMHSQDGLGECAGCHGASITALGTKTISGSGATKLTVSDWANAVATPTGLVGSTQITVASVKLSSSGGIVTSKTASNQNLILQFDHSLYQTNCSSCHTGGTYSTGKFHASQATQPVSCKGCHTSALESFIVGYVPKPIDHQHASVTAKDCATCHASPTSTVSNILFKDGTFHTKMTTQPSSCKDCHSPKILDQPTWGSMNHANISNNDCAVCHAFPGKAGTTAAPKWAGTTKGAPDNITLSPPTGQTTIGNLNLAHPALLLSGISCASCHGTSATIKIKGYDHMNQPVGSKCVYCHYTGQQVTLAQVSTRKTGHENFTLTTSSDCFDCHKPTNPNLQVTYPTWNSTTGTWNTDGKWKN